MSTTKQVLEDLHSELAKTLKKYVSKSYQDDEGNDTAPPAAILNVARQFLKDNNIDAIPTEGSPLGALKGALPFSGASEVH
jgi:hypothetical protein